jgi:hypothetical protein
VLPTVGVSFGLPFPNYGQGYPISPFGHPVAPNQHFGAIGPNGLNLGLLNVNPLVSVQLTKNEHGEKLLKPLVNLHVTPNAGIIGAVGKLFAHKKGALHNHHHTHFHRYPPPPPHYLHGPPHGSPFDHHHGIHDGPPPFLHGNGPIHPPIPPPEPYHPGHHFGPDFHGPPTGPGPIFHGPPTGPTGPSGPPPFPFYKDNSEVSFNDHDHHGIDFNPELNSFRSINASIDEQALQELKRNYNYQSFYPQNVNKFNGQDANSQQQQQRQDQYANNYNNYDDNYINNRLINVPTQAPGSNRGSKTITFPNNRRKRDTDQVVPDSVEPKETLESVHDSDDDSSEGRALSVGKVLLTRSMN